MINLHRHSYFSSFPLLLLFISIIFFILVSYLSPLCFIVIDSSDFFFSCFLSLINTYALLYIQIPLFFFTLWLFIYVTFFLRPLKKKKWFPFKHIHYFFLFPLFILLLLLIILFTYLFILSTYLTHLSVSKFVSSPRLYLPFF